MRPSDGWAWARYRVPLRAPTTAGGGRERQGVLISLDGEVGEAAPLPGLHAETLDSLVELLSRPLPLTGIPEQATARELLSHLNSDSRFAALPPSLRFGLESAALRRAATLRRLDLVDFLWPGGAAPAPPSVGLFLGDAAAAAAACERGEFEGCPGVKIKVGRRKLAQDVAVIETFRTLRPGAEIRLDANRSFDRGAMAELDRAVDGLDVAFVEEPFADPADLEAHLQEGRGMPVALDETLVGAVRAGRRPPTGPLIAAWVLKPSLLGVLASLRLIEAAGPTAAIVSSSFESPIGLSMLRAMASGSPAAPGLGTERWFAAEPGPDHLSPWRPVPEAPA